uniref:Tropinone reductase-like 1 n=1 Tax=Fagus sylvatica TaxID=28930 RepID=A0A2N9ICY1_FAGSY
MSKRLDGKVAIITGGAGGIGSSTVHLFHEHGAKVVIADIQDNLGQAIADKLGENVSYIHCDVTNEDEISQAPSARILDTKKSDLERVLSVNLVGSFLGAKHAARVMVPQRKGCILFTSSAATAISGLSSHAYTASKCGMLGVARNLAAELGQYGIRVNCVSPYAVMTGSGMSTEGVSEADATKLEAALSEVGNLKGQILKVEDVARAALYLASDEANYVSGLNLLVDGGYSVVNPSMMKFVTSFSG